MTRIVTACLLLLIIVPALAAVPIANYPMQVDDVDITGNYSMLSRTNAPFQDGGVWFNGIYIGAGPEGSHFTTPLLTALDLESFSVSIDFSIHELPVSGRCPVIVAGPSYRWAGVEIAPDGNVSLMYNNANYVDGSVVVAAGEWHTALLTYDGISDDLKVFVDGHLSATVNTTLVHDGDKLLSATNGATSRVFWGLLRNLVVYDSAFTPVGNDAMTWGAVKQTYR